MFRKQLKENVIPPHFTDGEKYMNNRFEFRTKLTTLKFKNAEGKVVKKIKPVKGNMIGDYLSVKGIDNIEKFVEGKETLRI